MTTLSNIEASGLQGSRSYAEAIVDTVREPLLVLDAKLCVHSVNQSFCDLFQVTSGKVLGRPLRELDNGMGEASVLLPLLRAVVKTGRAMEDFEIPYHSAALGVRALLLNARPLRHNGGRPNLILVAIDDATERRRIHKSLQQKEDRLREEERVWQRQLELSDALRVSTVGELAAGLAHELNQPLSSISNLVEACSLHVQSGAVDAARHVELLSDIADEAMRAAGIVAHLRSLVDKGDPQLELVDLADIVRRVPRLLYRELERSHISLNIDIAEEAMPVEADTIQIEQVIVNLLQNATDSIREAETRTRRIDVSVRSSAGMAEVSVRDTGTGICVQAAERMFGAFFTTKKHGLGMGLALSRSILEAHRGRIWVEDPSDGQPGTIVRFAIPLKAQQPQGMEAGS